MINTKIKSEALKGHKGYWTGKEFSEQMKQKIKDSKKGKKRKPFSKEWKQNMSESKIGENHPNFKGRIKNSQGYILIYSPDHPNRDKNNNVRESRLIVEAQIGRYLDPNWVVHHINGIVDDNRIENLMCFINNSAHKRFHKDPNNVKIEEIIFDGRKLKEM